MNKTNILKMNYEFKRVLNKGKYFGEKNIEAFVIKNNFIRNKNRLGIAVSVKLAKAVKRNKIKRLIRENYRLLEDDLYTGYEIVFLWKKKSDIKNANFFNVKQDMLKILKNIGMINNEKSSN